MKSLIELKTLLIIAFFLSIEISNGQDTLTNFEEKIVINDSLTAKVGETYIDGIKIELGKVFIHENNIKEIKLHKEESAKIYSGAKGVLIITRRKKYEFIDLSKFIADIKKQNEKLKSEQNIEIMINDILINKPEEYRIELNPEIKITIQKYSEDGIYHGGNKNKPKTQIIIKLKK